jgi:hypothetical protein
MEKLLELGQIRIDIFTNYVDPVWMKITYLPTGISVEGKGKSQLLLKRKLLEELKKKLSKSTGSLGGNQGGIGIEKQLPVLPNSKISYNKDRKATMNIDKTGSLIVDGTALQGKPFYCGKKLKLSKET